MTEKTPEPHMKNQTKELFAEQLYKLLTVKSFEKIQVKDLCQSAGTSRQTFYYHFQDKYDLIAWIFLQDYRSVFDHPDPDDYADNLKRVLDIIYMKRSFYKQVFTEHSQNSISNYIQQFDIDMGVQAVKDYYGLDEVTEEQLYLIKYHSYGTIHMTIEWLLHQNRMTAEEFAAIQLKSMPDFLCEAYLHTNPR